MKNGHFNPFRSHPWSYSRQLNNIWPKKNVKKHISFYFYVKYPITFSSGKTTRHGKLVQRSKGSKQSAIVPERGYHIINLRQHDYNLTGFVFIWSIFVPISAFVSAHTRLTPACRDGLSAPLDSLQHLFEEEFKSCSESPIYNFLTPQLGSTNLPNCISVNNCTFIMYNRKMLFM